MRRFSVFCSLFFVALSQTAFAANPGTLSITQNSIQAGSIPLGAQRVVVLPLALQASCGADVHLQALTIHHTGAGSVSDIAKIYAVAGTTRLTRGSVLQQISSSAVLSFSPPLTIKQCATTQISIAMDLSPTATAGSQHAFSLLSSADIQSDATVQIQASAKQSGLSTTPSTNGSVSFTNVPLTSTNVLFGADRTLLRFRLKALGSTGEAIDAMTFTNDGSARDTDLQNLFVAGADGRRVSSIATSLVGDSVRIVFSPSLALLRNETRLFTLHADITASNRKTIQLTIEEPSDIEAHASRGS